MTPPKVTLLPASNSDIRTLAQISNLAFKTDTHTRLKELTLGSDHAAEMEPVLENWMGRGERRCVVVKAVVSKEREGGKGGEEVVGWACWGFHGFDGESAKENPTDVEKSKESDEKDDETNGGTDKGKGTQDSLPQQPNPSEPQIAPQNLTKIQQLAHLTNTSMSNLSSILMPTPSTQCCILVAITVQPSYQSLGIGSSLISYGTQMADTRGVFSWVSSSDNGYRAFEKHGFREIGRLELELDVFGEGVMNESAAGGKWGPYVWRYMKREVDVASLGENKME